jgi:hypothetical protein
LPAARGSGKYAFSVPYAASIAAASTDAPAGAELTALSIACET